MTKQHWPNGRSIPVQMQGSILQGFQAKIHACTIGQHGRLGFHERYANDVSVRWVGACSATSWSSGTATSSFHASSSSTTSPLPSSLLPFPLLIYSFLLLLLLHILLLANLQAHSAGPWMLKCFPPSFSCKRRLQAHSAGAWMLKSFPPSSSCKRHLQTHSAGAWMLKRIRLQQESQLRLFMLHRPASVSTTKQKPATNVKQLRSQSVTTACQLLWTVSCYYFTAAIGCQPLLEPKSQKWQQHQQLDTGCCSEASISLSLYVQQKLPGSCHSPQWLWQGKASVTEKLAHQNKHVIPLAVLLIT